MGLLPGTVQLLDVDDVDGFVNDAINRTPLRPSASEREELELEAIAELYEMAADHRGGSLAARASGLLPLRIIAASRRLHRGEIVRGRDATGRCVSRRAPAIASLDELRGDYPDWEPVSLSRARPLSRFERPTVRAAGG